MVKKLLCDNKTLITSVMKIVVSVSSVLIAGGMIWLISTVNASERRIDKSCADIELQEARIKNLESISTDRFLVLSNMNREIGELNQMVKFLAEKQGYQSEEKRSNQ